MKIFYFTASYPYGIGEQWKANELNELVHYFEEIIVVPYSYDGNFRHPKLLPNNIKGELPLFKESSFKFNKVVGLFKILMSPHRAAFFKEFREKKVYKSSAHVVSWLYASLNVVRLMQHPLIRQINQGLNNETILYFFWGKGAAEFLPFMDTSRCYTTFVRMHRYDLFETVNNNYIPYRRALIENIDTVAPSSAAGEIHLKALYPDQQRKIKLFRLGTLSNGKKAGSSMDGVLRIVSCSYLSAVKRVSIMVESLRYIDFPIIWRHVGDGAEREQINSLIAHYGLQEKFIIEGMIDTGQLLDFYTSNTFDLFVNVSASEGVPMSIMESLSVSIPVMATAVGGNGELVDDTVGKLLPADLTPEQLASALIEYYQLPDFVKQKQREAAFLKSKEQCDAVQLAKDLAGYLKAPHPDGI